VWSVAYLAAIHLIGIQLSHEGTFNFCLSHNFMLDLQKNKILRIDFKILEYTILHLICNILKPILIGD
jgi:hypothetical protein